ncbi:MAG TPA: nicotinate-nucleotide adenylyltransferase [Methylophilaceae bacterium]|nr:nicotinate-nucleotide adenylyltransferase [Methylophilaceae bacterium]
MQAIGILGGTFDPIHFGHLRMAQELYDELHLANVHFVPAASPPHRDQPQTTTTHRVAMTRLAIATNPAFTLDTRELGRPGPSYTFDTLSELRAELGADKPLCLLIGGDAFLGLPTWHRWRELLAHAHIVVAHRPGAVPSEAAMSEELRALWRQHGTDNPAHLHASPGGSILLHRITALDISASSIRASLRQGGSVRYLLPDAVADFIQTYHLYQKEPHGT